eukprot:TRINITY_DN30015_c0_g1_i1.p1 TRINITY_DN30015_c0_g1~~TRINITY_DN30015_c0_g1_i1.p1  ORF type:complete len:360 (+),score=28.99 TRINITY_DN30015_c0_g1_i1:68-1147(+)
MATVTRFISKACPTRNLVHSRYMRTTVQRHMDAINGASTEAEVFDYMLGNPEWFSAAMTEQFELRIPSRSPLIVVGLEPRPSQGDGDKMPIRGALRRLLLSYDRMTNQNWLCGDRSVFKAEKVKGSSFECVVASKMVPGILLDSVTERGDFVRNKDLKELIQMWRPFLPADVSHLLRELDGPKLKKSPAFDAAVNCIFGNIIGWGNLLPIGKDSSGDWPFQGYSFPESSPLNFLRSPNTYKNEVLPSRADLLKEMVRESNATTLLLTCGLDECDRVFERLSDGKRPAKIEVQANIQEGKKAPKSKKASFYHTTFAKCDGSDVHVFGLPHPCSSTRDEWWIEAMTLMRDVQPALREHKHM